MAAQVIPLAPPMSCGGVHGPPFMVVTASEPSVLA
jgi:hypothetical protein